MIYERCGETLFTAEDDLSGEVRIEHGNDVAFIPAADFTAFVARLLAIDLSRAFTSADISRITREAVEGARCCPAGDRSREDDD